MFIFANEKFKEFKFRDLELLEIIRMRKIVGTKISYGAVN